MHSTYKMLLYVDDNNDEKRLWNICHTHTKKSELKMKMKTELECKESIFDCLLSF